MGQLLSLARPYSRGMRRRKLSSRSGLDHGDAWAPVLRAAASRLSLRFAGERETLVLLLEACTERELQRATRALAAAEASAVVSAVTEALDRAHVSLEAVQGGRMHRDELSGALHLLAQRDEPPVTRALVGILQEQLGAHSDRGGPLPSPPIARTLQKTFDLSDEERSVLVALFAANELDDVHTLLHQQADRRALAALADVAGTTVAEYARLTAAGGRLERFGLITHGRGSRDSWSDVSLCAPVLFSFLSHTLEDLSGGVFAAPREARLTPEDFPVPSVERAVIQGALSAGRSVLLAGAAGVGKTEFAFAVAAAMGRSVRSVETAPRQGGGFRERSSAQDRMALARMAARLIDSEREILLIDEADAILQSAGGILGAIFGGSSFDKAELNTFLEELSVPTIWITNSVAAVPPSAMRRFGHVCRFSRPTRRGRERIISDRLRTAELPLEPDAARDIVRRYDLSPAAIDRLVCALESAPDRAPAELSRFADAYLRAGARGPLAHEYRPLPSAVSNYDASLCNASVPVAELLHTVRTRANSGRATRLLFEGPPGGGKTQFALHLADELGREALVQRPSDLLSPFVGEAEQNIARMFARAEATDSILILDEADALLADRAGAAHSWEVTQAAEFLQGLQSFGGTLIACTNRIDAIDPALRRRFHRQVCFRALGSRQILDALRRFFPDHQWTDAHADPLGAAPPLMLSDIANAADMLTSDPEAGLCDAETIITEIIANARARDRTRLVGF
ncbi:MAG: AAA family ATPase [Spirochaetaceae bacterium]|nr:MAG: AAA family ATPase [Spirochaetaceae bacterium]